MSNTSPNNKRAARMAFGLFAIVGAVFVAIAASFLAVQASIKNRCTEPVPAVVTDLVKRTSHKSGSRRRLSVTYAPVYEYSYKGRNYKYISTVSSGHPSVSVGDRVTIMIDPNDPSFVCVNDGIATVLIISFIAFGAVFIIIGGAGLIKTFSKKEKDTLQ